MLRRFKKVLLPELTDGHLALLLRGEVPDRRRSRFSKMHGQPFKVSELVEAIRKLHGA